MCDTLQIFDQNADGRIDRKEWVFVVEFVTAQHAIAVRKSRTQPTSRLSPQMRAQMPKDMIVQLASEGEAASGTGRHPTTPRF